MQCGYRETLVPTRDLATKQGLGNILFHDQLTDTESMTSARVTLTTFESAVFDGGAYNSLTDELVFTVCSIPRDVSVTDNYIIPTAMRNEKTVVTNFTKCVIVAF